MACGQASLGQRGGMADSTAAILARAKHRASKVEARSIPLKLDCNIFSMHVCSTRACIYFFHLVGGKTWI